jgi:hypothetical protein
LQEISASIEKVVEHLMELYQERSNLRLKVRNEQSDISV